MSAAMTNPSMVSGVPPVKAAWSTPKRLRVLIGLAWALVGILFVVGEVRLDAARHAVKTIGKDAAPSIIAAQEIRLILTEIDANVANTLIGSPAHRAAAFGTVEAQRTVLARTLVEAAQNITFGDAEKVPIQALFTKLGTYLDLAAEARVLFDRSKETSALAEKDARGALSAYWRATSLLHAELIKAADDLDGANRAYLDHAYKDERKSEGAGEALALLLGGALIALLVYTQLFFFRHMRRILNPALLVATLLSVGYTGYLVTRFTGATANLKLAVEDAFESVHTLVKARAIAYDANGDESRWLLDQSPARDYEGGFRSKVAMLTSSPEAAAPRSGRDVTFTGLFADELKNITFEGELEAARVTVQKFREYYLIDGEIRRLFRAGKRDAAIELCIGDRPEQSNAAFYRFDQALVEVIAINRKAFDRAIDTETSALKSAEIIAPFFALAIAALAFLGIRARLKEYRA